MAILTIRRKPKTKTQRALNTAGRAASVAGTFIKARIAWLAGKKATKVAAPAVAVGTAAVVVKKRSGGHPTPQEEGTNAHAPTPAGVA